MVTRIAGYHFLRSDACIALTCIHVECAKPGIDDNICRVRCVGFIWFPYPELLW
jgi:hypothetical protein